jgi:uncharacterized protein RhaS with RHS repeats
VCARFISEDPIGWASGQTNNYAYVGGDPVSFTDPSGMWSIGFEEYYTLGGGMQFTCSGGQLEVFVRVGVGVGGGAGFDPAQKVTDHAERGGGWILRWFVTAGLDIPAVTESVNVSVTARGDNLQNPKKRGPSGEAPPPLIDVSGTQLGIPKGPRRPKLGAVVSGGGEIGGYHPVAACK